MIKLSTPHSRRSRGRRLRIGLATGVLSLSLASLSSGAVIFENFEYGETGGTLLNLGAAGAGWAGSWTGSNRHSYYPAENLFYDAPGYSNETNGPGVAGRGDGNAGHALARQFTMDLGGTVWISALIRVTNSNAGRALLYLQESTGANYVGLTTGSRAELRFGAGTAVATEDSFGVSKTHLFLVRLQFAEDLSDLDTIDLWVNPDLSGGEFGLGAATLSASANIGDSLNRIGVTFQSDGSRLDAIRISNDVNGFAQVTAVPEPSVSILVALASLGFLGLRRRKC